jgi:hypothetical protein
MAKISTYPGPSSPSISDMLIGTDVNDMNATKNFTIGDILSVPGSGTYVPYTGATNDVFLLGYGFYANEFVVYGGTSSQFLKADGSIDSTQYVPYTGAITDLNLGAYNITATALKKVGGLSTEFLKADGSVDNNTYLTSTTAATTYVPYTGATGNVDLGTNRLIVKGLITTTDDVEMIGLTPPSAINDYFEIGNWGWNGKIGLLIDFVNDKYFIGDRLSAVNGTYILVDDANQEIEITQALKTNGSVGAIGQVLTSQGPGLPAQWDTPYVVPTYGSFYDTNTQPTAGASFELMKFGTNDIVSGITITNDALGNPTKITFSATGVYNIQFSAQLKKTGGAGATIFYIYLIKDGTAVPNSATAVTLENNGDLLVAAWNWFIDIFSLPSDCQIGWYTNNANGELHYDAAPVVGIPAIPSVILTVNRIS